MHRRAGKDFGKEVAAVRRELRLLEKVTRQARRGHLDESCVERPVETKRGLNLSPSRLKALKLATSATSGSSSKGTGSARTARL
jgi:hypothetical protein